MAAVKLVHIDSANFIYPNFAFTVRPLPLPVPWYGAKLNLVWWQGVRCTTCGTHSKLTARKAVRCMPEGQLADWQESSQVSRPPAFRQERCHQLSRSVAMQHEGRHAGPHALAALGDQPNNIRAITQLPLLTRAVLIRDVTSMLMPSKRNTYKPWE